MSVSHQFQTLDKLVESTAQLCKNGASSEVQVGAMLSVCEELQHILRYAFIENGFLANRVEGLILHQKGTVDKLERRIKLLETERKIAQRQIKRLRKSYSVLSGVKRVVSSDSRWNVAVKCSDYDSLTSISRIAGSPDLEYMLRLNQLIINFVKDAHREELPLPLMGTEERSELSKLATLYKLRMKCGKSTSVATVVLAKGRNTSLPSSGDVDSLLSRFTKTRLHTISSEATHAGEKKLAPLAKDPVPLRSNKDAEMRSKASHDTAEAEDTKPDDSSSVVQPKPMALVKSSAAVPKTTTTPTLDLNTNLLNLLAASTANKQSTSSTTQTPQVALLYSNPPSALQSLGQKAIPIIIRRTSPNTPPVIQLAPSTSVAALRGAQSQSTSSASSSGSVECAKITDPSALVNILAQQLIGRDIQQIQSSKSATAAGIKRSQEKNPNIESDVPTKKHCESTDEEIIKVD